MTIRDIKHAFWKKKTSPWLLFFLQKKQHFRGYLSFFLSFFFNFVLALCMVA